MSLWCITLNELCSQITITIITKGTANTVTHKNKCFRQDDFADTLVHHKLALQSIFQTTYSFAISNP